jgi:ATP-binding cassette subfamily B protein
MSRKKLDFRAEAFQNVLGFTFRHWGKQPGRIATIVVLIMGATLAEVATPLFAGQLVDAIATGSPETGSIWNQALNAFWLMAALYLASVVLRSFTFMNIITLTLKMMADIGAEAFHRVQRFSTDWHANSFAGSTVRKITRGMWALDLLNDTILMALLPSLRHADRLDVLLRSSWPMMGLDRRPGLADLHRRDLGAVARLCRAGGDGSANAWDTRLGGALADAVSCNPVVKAFGAEAREETVSPWSSPNGAAARGRTWRRGTLNGTTQGLRRCSSCAGIIGVALFLWSRGRRARATSPSCLTSFFLLQGYLRDVGQHIRNLQRSVNDMEELVEPCRRSRIGVAIGRRRGRFASARAHRVRERHLPLRQPRNAALQGVLGVDPSGERVGLVGHSGRARRPSSS